jgi:hypothetical protein
LIKAEGKYLKKIKEKQDKQLQRKQLEAKFETQA